MSLAKLKLISRMRSQYPAAKDRLSEEDKQYEAYLKTLSAEELHVLFDQRMKELDNDPKWIAERDRLSKMTVEELTEEYFQKLREG
jgi:hypothetical protein